MMLYIIQSLAWSMVGFIIGWLVGREMYFVHQIREAVVPEGEREHNSHVPDIGGNRTTRIIGIIIVVLAILTISQGAYFISKQQAVVECQARFNKDFVEVLQKRNAFADRDRDALIRFFEASADSSDKTQHEAYLRLVRTYSENSELRNETPLPELDDRDCRE